MKRWEPAWALMLALVVGTLVGIWIERAMDCGPLAPVVK